MSSLTHTCQISAHDYSNASLQLTSKLLSQNPEYYTIWNDRRRILQHVFEQELEEGGKSTTAPQQDIDAAQKAGLSLPQREISLLIQEDLHFLLPLLKQFPKCYWIWNHRSWLLRYATSHLPPHATLELWQAELGLVSKMLALDSRNFHGWSYRREVIAEMEKLSGSSMAEKEFEYTTRMIGTNLSNFSAWHYRSQLISTLLHNRRADSEQRRITFDAELELITRALYTDPYDQSLWFYHEYLMATLDSSNAGAQSILHPCTDADRTAYLSQELESIRDMLDGAEDCKYIYHALLQYSNRLIGLGGHGSPTAEMKEWLSELRKMDPLRARRWEDLETKLKL